MHSATCSLETSRSLYTVESSKTRDPRNESEFQEMSRKKDPHRFSKFEPIGSVNLNQKDRIESSEHMEFPVDVMRIIRDYAKPCTRPDWRTCKKTESLCIKMAHWKYHLRTWNLFTSRDLCQEIANWSLYGKIHLLHIIRSRRLWFPVATQDWYELKIRFYIDPVI